MKEWISQPTHESESTTDHIRLTRSLKWYVWSEQLCQLVAVFRAEYHQTGDATHVGCDAACRCAWRCLHICILKDFGGLAKYKSVSSSFSVQAQNYKKRKMRKKKPQLVKRQQQKRVNAYAWPKWKPPVVTTSRQPGWLLPADFTAVAKGIQGHPKTHCCLSLTRRERFLLSRISHSAG